MYIHAYAFKFVDGDSQTVDGVDGGRGASGGVNVSHLDMRLFDYCTC